MFVFLPTQQFRLILNGVSIYTTARAIRNGIGDMSSCNSVAQLALHELECANKGADSYCCHCQSVTGCSENWPYQLDVLAD